MMQLMLAGFLLAGNQFITTAPMRARRPSASLGNVNGMPTIVMTRRWSRHDEIVRRSVKIGRI